MFFRKTIDEIKSQYNRLKIFVDMDGVIADYIVGEARDYDKKMNRKERRLALIEKYCFNEY